MNCGGVCCVRRSESEVLLSYSPHRLRIGTFYHALEGNIPLVNTGLGGLQDKVGI